MIDKHSFVVVDSTYCTRTYCLKLKMVVTTVYTRTSIVRRTVCACHLYVRFDGGHARMMIS